jgi:hypothetical protein
LRQARTRTAGSTPSELGGCEPADRPPAAVGGFARLRSGRRCQPALEARASHDRDTGSDPITRSLEEKPKCW